MPKAIVIEKDVVLSLLGSAKPRRVLPLLFVPALILLLAGGWLHQQTRANAHAQIEQLQSERVHYDFQSALERLQSLQVFVANSSLGLQLQSSLSLQREHASERLVAAAELMSVDALRVSDQRNTLKFSHYSARVDAAQVAQSCAKGAGIYAANDGVLVVQQQQWLTARGDLKVCSAANLTLGLSAHWRLVVADDSVEGILLPRIGERQYRVVLQQSPFQFAVNPFVYVLVFLGLLSAVAVNTWGWWLWRQRALNDKAVTMDNQLMSVALSGSREAMLWLDSQGHIVRLNPALLRLLNQQDSQLLLGQPWQQVLKLEGATGQLVDPVSACQRLKSPLNGQLTVLQHQYDRKVACDYYIQPLLRGVLVVGSILTLRDRSQQAELEHAIRASEYYDSVSGLLKRREFAKAASAQMGKGLTTGSVLAVLDIDGFTLLNQTSGWERGDRVLRQIATELQALATAGDLFCRLEGDCFACLLQREHYQLAINELEHFQEILSDLTLPDLALSYDMRASVGLVTLGQHGSHFEHAMGGALTALKQAQQAGGNQLYAMSLAEHPVQTHSEAEWVRVIQDALRHDRLMLYVQPAKSLQDNDKHTEIWEVFVRLMSDNAEVIRAADFLPVAKRHGLMSDIDRWVMKHLISSALLPRLLGEDGCGLVSIHLSAGALLSEEFLLEFHEQLALAQVDPSQICIEVAESLLQPGSNVLDTLQAVSSLGCRIMIDDFSAGPGSLAMLKTLPVDYVKFNRELIEQSDHDFAGRRLLETLNAIAQDLELCTVAECVESAAVIEVLHELGVDYCQGYAIARPFPLDELQLGLHQAKSQLRQTGETQIAPSPISIVK